MDPQRILPPRDFKRWRALPAASIACWKPITARDLSEQGLASLLQSAPHSRFPALDAEGRVLGILLREEAERAVCEKRAPGLLRSCWVPPDTPLAEVQAALLDSDTDLVCVGTPEAPASFGILTLHDFLRAQNRLDEEAAN